MKTLPTGMTAHLSTGATTLCWCWKLTRADGVVIGFTDHDRDLTVAGVTYEAAAGFTASEVKSATGLAVDDLEVDGALNSDALTEDDLQAGLWDNASVELRRVNWDDTSQAVLMRKGSIGEVRRGSKSFTAELRGLAHALNQEIGRVYGYSCDASLGDSRCGIDTTKSAWRFTGVVTARPSAVMLDVSGASAYADGTFSRGTLALLGSGGAVLTSIEIRHHIGDRLTLWMAPDVAIAIGDSVRLVAGCDKQYPTCRDRFTNATNFRGFPYMPSNDLVASYPTDDTVNDGGSLYGN